MLNVLQRKPLANLALALALTGCTSQKPATLAPTTQNQQPTTPPRPTVAPPPFRVFHTTDSSITLVTKPNATDDEITSLIWQLRDAAHAHSLDKLKIDQKMVDARKPSVWFHIYRGPKCAAEKYADGAPPCGPSYHAAGDYTFGGGPANPQWDSGLLIHDEDHETRLWNPDAPYTAPSP
jgi:hypothetical protein